MIVYTYFFIFKLNFVYNETNKESIMSFNFIDEKYIRQMSMYLNRFRDVGNGTYNARCPICGDSAKSATKARGYFYLSDNNRWRYKCHNCAINLSFAAFLKQVVPTLYSDYSYECFKEKSENSSNAKKEKIKSVIVNEQPTQTHHKTRNTKSVILTHKILSELISLADLDNNNSGYKYITERSIPRNRMEKLYYTQNLKDVVKHIPEYDISRVPEIEGIIIPYFTEDGILESFQIRNIDKSSNMRYLTYDLNEEVSNIYNYENIESDKPVYVFEGAFDSMFCVNGVAASGSSIIQKLDKIKNKNKNIVVVFDNDYKTNDVIRKLLDDVINKGFSVVLFDDNMRGYKDINSYAVAKNKGLHEITEYLQKCTYSDMAAKLVLAEQKKQRGSIKWVNETYSTQRRNHSKINKNTQVKERKNSLFTI